MQLNTFALGLENTGMGYKEVICPECRHANERFITESVSYAAEQEGRSDEEAELTICGHKDNDESGCGRTLRYFYVPSAGEMVVESLPTHEVFLND